MIEVERSDLEVAVDKLLSKVAIEIFSKSQMNLVEYKIVDTGFLMNSGRVRIDKFMEKEIIYSAKYAGYVEFGTQPHFPPVNAIRDWVRRKLNIRNRKEAESVAWAIANKIAKEGTRPRHFLRDAINYAKGKYKEIEVEVV